MLIHKQYKITSVLNKNVFLTQINTVNILTLSFILALPSRCSTGFPSGITFIRTVDNTCNIKQLHTDYIILNSKQLHTDYIILRPKLKNCLLPAPDRPLENVATRNIFLCDLRQLFFFWLLEIMTGSSDIVPEFTFGTGLHF